MSVCDFKCVVCGIEKSMYVMTPPYLVNGEKMEITCCGGLMDIQNFQEPDLPVGLDNSNIVIKTSDYTQRLQKMAAERAKKYKKQEAEHRSDYAKRKFGL